MEVEGLLPMEIGSKMEEMNEDSSIMAATGHGCTPSSLPMGSGKRNNRKGGNKKGKKLRRNDKMNQIRCKGMINCISNKDELGGGKDKMYGYGMVRGCKDKRIFVDIDEKLDGLDRISNEIERGNVCNNEFIKENGCGLVGSNSEVDMKELDCKFGLNNGGNNGNVCNNVGCKGLNDKNDNVRGRFGLYGVSLSGNDGTGKANVHPSSPHQQQQQQQLQRQQQQHQQHQYGNGLRLLKGIKVNRNGVYYGRQVCIRLFVFVFVLFCFVSFFFFLLLREYATNMSGTGFLFFPVLIKIVALQDL